MPSDAASNARGPVRRHARSITLIRHGRTAYNLARRIQGGIDIPLDEVGRWQVHETGEVLRNLYVRRRPDATPLVVSSDLGRAMETAHAFADPLGLAVHPDQRMRERDFGDWEGMSADELSTQYPEDFSAWMRMRGGELRHGAETKRHVGMRGVEGLKQWSTDAGPDTDLFVFAHGAWIAETVQTMLGLDRISGEMPGMLSMRNAHWARLVPLDGRGWGTPADQSFERVDTIWRLMDYNHGPAIADTPEWERTSL